MVGLFPRRNGCSYRSSPVTTVKMLLSNALCFITSRKFDDLKQNFEFYHNSVNSILYLYLDKGYSHELYEDIERDFTLPSLVRV